MNWVTLWVTCFSCGSDSEERQCDPCCFSSWAGLLLLLLLLLGTTTTTGQAAPQRRLQTCFLKNVPKTASTPYEWCPSPVPEVDKSKVKRKRVRNTTNTVSPIKTATIWWIKSSQLSLLEPFSAFPAVCLPCYSSGRRSPERPRSSRRGKRADKANSASPSAAAPSPAGSAETTGLCLAASW